MHANQTPDFCLFARTAVNDGIALLNRPLIRANIGQLAITAVFQLECKGNKRIGRIVAD